MEQPHLITDRLFMASELIEATLEHLSSCSPLCGHLLGVQALLDGALAHLTPDPDQLQLFDADEYLVERV